MPPPIWRGSTRPSPACRRCPSPARSPWRASVPRSCSATASPAMPDDPDPPWHPDRLLPSLKFRPARRAVRRFVRERGRGEYHFASVAVSRPLHGGQQDCDDDEDDRQQRDQIGGVGSHAAAATDHFCAASRPMAFPSTTGPRRVRSPRQDRLIVLGMPITPSIGLPGGGSPDQGPRVILGSSFTARAAASAEVIVRRPFRT